MIHAMVNNHQDEHQSTVIESSGTVSDQTFCILIDLGSTNRFIFGAVLKRIKVKEVKQDEFRYIEIASGDKRKVGGKVIDYHINLGYFVMKENLYVMILGCYDIVINMD